MAYENGEWVATMTEVTLPAVGVTEAAGEWYDLNGRRQDGVPAAKGIYINRGKKRRTRRTQILHDYCEIVVEY